MKSRVRTSGLPAVLALALVLALPGNAGAQAQARAISWPAGIEQDPVVRLGADGALAIDAPEGTDLTVVEIDRPGVSQPFFGLRMRLRHEGVSPAGFIQMDAGFAPGEVYFSREPLAGERGWRQLDLPFSAARPDGDWRPPETLRLRLILPGGGRVGLSGLQLIEASAWNELMRPPGGWWSVSEAAWIGAVGGVLFGSLGALVGILIGRGRARGPALALCWLSAALAVAALVVGLIALASGQVYAVYYPLLLIGALGTIIFPLLGLRARHAYAGRELRRIRARDAVRR